MPERINWSLTFEAVLGPRIGETGSQDVSAYDKLMLDLAAGAADEDVDVQPSANAGDVELLVIKASSYDAPAVTYSPDAGANTFTLDGPVVLIGSGAVALLAAAPTTLRFDNPGASVVGIEILVGRQA